MPTPGRIFSVIYSGDVYNFFVDAEMNLVKVECQLLGTMTETIAFADVPQVVRDDLIQQLYAAGS